MGVYLTDQFSLLHFATGIIVYFWGISLSQWFILHVLYEIITNTKWGIYIINTYSSFPGGKLNYDTGINIIGDQLYGILGWIFTHFFIKYFYGGEMNDIYKYNGDK